MPQSRIFSQLSQRETQWVGEVDRYIVRCRHNMMGNLLWRYVAKIIRKSADGYDVLISLTALHLHYMALERRSVISIVAWQLLWITQLDVFGLRFMYLLEYSIICLPNIMMGRSESEDMEFYKLIEGDQKKIAKEDYTFLLSRWMYQIEPKWWTRAWPANRLFHELIMWLYRLHPWTHYKGSVMPMDRHKHGIDYPICLSKVARYEPTASERQ